MKEMLTKPRKKNTQNKQEQEKSKGGVMETGAFVQAEAKRALKPPSA